MQFGKEIEEKSYMNGAVSAIKHTREVSIKIESDEELVNLILNAIKLVRDKQTNKLTLEIEANPKTYVVSRFVQRWVVERKQFKK